jgi:hypothetical protein
LNAKSVVDALQIAVPKLEIFTAKYALQISTSETKQCFLKEEIQREIKL